MENWVRDTEGLLRPVTSADSVLHVNDDGTVTIPADVEVYDVDGILALRVNRLAGWANLDPSSEIVYPGGQRTLGEEVTAALARQGREILPWLPRPD